MSDLSKSYLSPTFEETFDRLMSTSVDTLDFEFDLRPLTRRERVRYALSEYRYRIIDAIDVLRGRHECGCC
jgi:hypothetical protein